MQRLVAVPGAVARQSHPPGFDEDDCSEVARDQPLDPDEHFAEHLVEGKRRGDRRRCVAQRLGVGPLLALLGLQSDAVFDLAAQRFVRRHQFGRAVLHPLVELVKRALELLFRAAAVGDVFERAEHADDAAVEIAERHFVGLQPAVLTRRVAQLLDDAERRFAALHHLAVPVDEPVGAERRAIGPRHVAVGHADQDAGFHAGEAGEHLVASQVPRLEVFPEHGIGHRVHQDLQHLLARRQRVGPRQLTLQQAGVHVANLRSARVGGSVGTPRGHGAMVDRNRGRPAIEVAVGA